MNDQLKLFDNQENHDSNEKSDENGQSFYVYCLINSLNNSIIYVGKGKGNRSKQHLKEYYLDKKEESKLKLDITRNFNQKDKIRSNKGYYFDNIYSNGGNVIDKIIFPNLTNTESFMIEKVLILIIGRQNQILDTIKYEDNLRYYLWWTDGPLLNELDGGEEVSKTKIDLQNFNYDFSETLFFYNSVRNKLEESNFIKTTLNIKYPHQEVEYLIKQKEKEIKNQIVNFHKNLIDFEKFKYVLLKIILIKPFPINRRIEGEDFFINYIQQGSGIFIDFLIHHRNNIFKVINSKVDDTPFEKIKFEYNHNFHNDLFDIKEEIKNLIEYGEIYFQDNIELLHVNLRTFTLPSDYTPPEILNFYQMSLVEKDLFLQYEKSTNIKTIKTSLSKKLNNQ